MEATEHWEGAMFPAAGRSAGTGVCWWIPVRARGVVVADVLGDNAVEVPDVEHDMYPLRGPVLDVMRGPEQIRVRGRTVNPSRLLFRGQRRRHGDVPDGQREFAFDEARPRGGPVLGCELEIAVAGPVRQHAEDLGEIALGVEPVQLARRDERKEVGGGLGVVVGPEERPRFTIMASSP